MLVMIFHRWITLLIIFTPAHTEKPNLSRYNRKQTQQISDECFSHSHESQHQCQCYSLLNQNYYYQFLYMHTYMHGWAGYRSKMFDTDTLSSIPVPERYFFRYQFYEISFNKITLSQKTLVLFFFSLLTFIQTQSLIS